MEGLLSTGPTPSSLILSLLKPRVVKHEIIESKVSWSQMLNQYFTACEVAPVDMGQLTSGRKQSGPSINFRDRCPASGGLFWPLWGCPCGKICWPWSGRNWRRASWAKLVHLPSQRGPVAHNGQTCTYARNTPGVLSFQVEFVNKIKLLFWCC